MKNLLLLLGVSLTMLLTQTTLYAQNIFGGEPVQVVGQMNGYSTASTSNSVYRRVSVTSGTPTDGRGQWMKTYNAQASGGDVLNSNMAGGGGNGFLFISGPSGNRFQNKWVFSGVGQAGLNAVNGITAYNSGNDMGLNMGTAGNYTFVFSDCGYTQTNAKFYIGYTASAPVTVSRTGQVFTAGSPVISITTSASPSAGENIYVRYRATTNDFTAGTSIVQASGSGTSWTATLPQQTCGSTVYYYVYSSTRTLSQINSDNESDRTMAALRYDDNAGANYSFTVSPVPTAGITNNSGTTVLTCTQTGISVTATGGASYSWDNGLGSGASKSIAAPGTYTVTVTGDNGCTSTAQISITQNITTPTAGITNNSGTTVLTCTQTAVSVTATGGASYSWDNGLGSGASKSITAPGTYTVTVTGANGCTATAQISITQNITAPTAGITNNSGTTVVNCNNSISVTATGGVSYSWDNGLGNNATAMINGAGTFTVTVTGANGCMNTASITTTANGTNTWNGTNGNFSDGSKWSCGVPSPGDVLSITAGNVTLDISFNVQGSFTLSNTATLTVSPTSTLSVGATGTLAFGGRPVTFKSDGTGTASLGQVLGTLSNATNVTVERFIPDNGFRSWRLLSVPTFGNGQTIRQAWQEGAANPLPFQDNLPGFGTQITGVGSSVVAQAAGFDSVAATASLLRWTGTAWAGITNTNTAIANFPAYFLFIRGDRTKGVTTTNNNSSSTTLRTNGTVYTGDQVNNIGTNAFALVPNLYSSAINFTGLTRTGGVSNLFYTWDSKKISGNSLGVYQTFSGTNSFNCMISGGSYTFGAPNTTIESGQGFFVQSTTAGTITLKETAKISGTNGSLGFRPSATPAKIDTRLYNSNDEMLDANTVVFDAAYDKAVDGDDAPKYGNPGANFAIETQSKLLAIEGTQPVADKDVIRFRMWNLQQQNYKLEIAAIKMNATGLTAVLTDSYLKTTTAIDLSATTAIKFSVDGNAGSSDANRFSIVFAKAKAVQITDTKQGYTIAPNPVENGVMKLQFNNQPVGKYTLRMITAGGQTLMVRTIIHTGGSTTQHISLPINKIAADTYIIEIISPGNSKTVQSIFVNKK